MLNSTKKIFLSLMMVFSITFMDAQNQNNSPYSRFGIGDLNDLEFVHLRTMGGISAAYIDRFHINTINPASYAFLSSTAFEIGTFANYSKLNDGARTSSSWNGGLEYFSLGFPLRNPINEAFDRIEKPYAFGMNFSLISNSNVDYNISSFEFAREIGEIERNYSGSGGTTKFLWGNGVKYNDFAFGINLGYLFGKINYERSIFFHDIRNSRDDNFVADYSIASFVFDAGFMYEKVLNKKEVEENNQLPAKRISLGVHFTPKRSFSTKSAEIKRTIYRLSEFTQFEDTLSYVTDIEGNGTLPMELGFGGVYYFGNKLAIGANYTFAKWSQYENEANPGSLNNSYKVSFGGFYRPDYRSFNKYLHRIFYRFGVYYGQDPRAVEEESLKTYGVNFGLGLPVTFQRKVSHVNLGFDLGRRGASAPIKETFFKVSLDLTFNDSEWFIKRKLD